MAQAVIDQITIEALGKFNSSFTFIDNIHGEVLGKVAALNASQVDKIIVEVLGQYTYQVGLPSIDDIVVEILGRANIAAARTEQISIDVLGQWSGF